MITVLNLNRSKIAILENAYNVNYEKQTNSIWSASFYLPLNDPKVDKVQQMKFVEIIDTDGEYIGLFRIMPSETEVSVSENRVKFECNHVLSLLMDSVMFRYHQISPNTSTREVLEYLLSLQKTKHWQLGQCEFTRYFQYSWENENGLVDALFSVPRIFDEEYRWEFDTQSYPWTINLLKTRNNPTCRVREGYNLKGFRVTSNPNQLVNRIYPLGQGEGVNQLNIKKVNPTGQYYVEDSESISTYGLVEYIWPDKRFTDARSLYTSALAILKKFKQPLVDWEIEAIDLIKAISDKPGQIIPKIDSLREGKVVQVLTEKYGKLNLRILRESKSDMFGPNKGDLELTIGYVPSDLGTTQADIERNIQINELYSQGATNILNYDKEDNCDPNFPVKFRIFIDDDVVKINTAELTFETSKFRSYSRAIKGGGAIVSTTKGGGAIVKSTSGGGAIVTSTGGGGATLSTTKSGGSIVTATGGGGAIVSGGTSEAAGQSTQTSSANGSHSHKVLMHGGRYNGGWDELERHYYWDASPTVNAFVIESLGNFDMETAEAADNHIHYVETPAHSHQFSFSLPNHTHQITLPNHTHEIELPNHTHEVNLPNHTHEVDLPNHTHEIELPDHAHEIDYGIWESPTTADQVRIVVDGNEIPGTDTRRERFDLIDYLSKGEDGTINRGWHTIEAIPNQIARISAQITMRVFIKSQLGGEF